MKSPTDGAEEPLYPSAPVLWVAFLAAAVIEPAPQLTGRKDLGGASTPAHAGEERKVRVYRWWGELKFRLFGLHTGVLPGPNLRLSFLWAVAMEPAPRPCRSRSRCGGWRTVPLPFY